MFVDIATIRLKAGNGGAGAVAFHREKFVAAGGPDGGDGGNGGDILFVADNHLSTLADFRYKRKYSAENGANGSGKKCSGKSGQHLVIKVPRGTVIKEKESGRILADISDTEPVVIAKGGRGGWGNARFATPTRQLPRFAKPGTPGEGLEVQLELKLLADVGLVGFPNVGKSTLISVVSEAKPEIANYHFTTLSPVLGVVRVGEEHSYVMADLPGLIEGASDGVGLGHDFLRHVDRCRLLVHVVDVSGVEGRDPIEDFKIINSELSAFSDDLADRPMMVAGNKSDIADPEIAESFRKYIEEQGMRYFEISAATATGTRELAAAVGYELDKLPPIKMYEPDPEPEAPKRDETAHGEFNIYQDDEDVYVIEAEWLGHVLGSVNMEDYESLQYFQRVLRTSGIIAELEKMGIQDGDTVRIFDFEFDFVV